MEFRLRWNRRWKEKKNELKERKRLNHLDSHMRREEKKREDYEHSILEEKEYQKKKGRGREKS